MNILARFSTGLSLGIVAILVTLDAPRGDSDLARILGVGAALLLLSCFPREGDE